jgi:hypothetical protein
MGFEPEEESDGAEEVQAGGDRREAPAGRGADGTRKVGGRRDPIDRRDGSYVLPVATADLGSTKDSYIASLFSIFIPVIRLQLAKQKYLINQRSVENVFHDIYSYALIWMQHL